MSFNVKWLCGFFNHMSDDGRTCDTNRACVSHGAMSVFPQLRGNNRWCHGYVGSGSNPSDLATDPEFQHD